MKVDQLKKQLEELKQMQENGAEFPCPRCGHWKMKKNMQENALSRRVSCYICSKCGQDEAYRDMLGKQMKLTEWGFRI